MLNIKLLNGELVSVKPIQYHKMSLLDGSTIIVKNFNPNHDSKGRFATGSGSSTSVVEGDKSALRQAGEEYYAKEAMKYDSEFEFRQNSTNQYWHATTPEGDAAIDKEGFKLLSGPRSVGMTKAKKGIWVFPEFQNAWWFSEGTAFGNTGIVTSANIYGKVAKVSTKYNLPTSQFIQPKNIKGLKEKGYVAITGHEYFFGSNHPLKPIQKEVTYVFEKDALFSRNQMTEIYNKAHGIKNSVETEKNFNPNHDAKGRFTTGSGSGGSDGFKEHKFSTEQFQDYKERYRGNISEEDSHEVSTYVQTGHKINTALEHGRGELDAKSLGYDIFEQTPRLEWGEARQKTIAVLDKNMAHELEGNTILFRGASLPKDLKVGQRIESYGYSSTTLSKKVGTDILRHKYIDKNNKLYLLKVPAPKGTKGLFTTAVTPYHDQYLASEQEFLLPRNSSFKITKVNPKPFLIDAGTPDERSYKKVEVEYGQQ